MVRRCVMVFSAFLAALAGQGCFNSESDYELLLTERDALATELKAASRENEILNQALDNIKKEQEALQIMLNTARSHMDAAAGGNTQSPPLPPLAGDSPTISWGGYDWNLPTDSAAGSGGATTGSGSASSQPAASEPTEKIYRPKLGDVLSQIALKHNTTVERLVELNPYLARRNNYMIWETDKIVVP